MAHGCSCGRRCWRVKRDVEVGKGRLPGRIFCFRSVINVTARRATSCWTFWRRIHRTERASLQFYLDNYVNCYHAAKMREMIRIAFLVGAAALAPGSASPAGAQTLYRCVLDGQVAAPDQLMSFEIAIKPNGEFGSIVLRGANGAAYDRGKQFDEQNSHDANGQRSWTGTLRTNPNVTITGSLSGKGDRPVYSEMLSDTVLGNVQIISTCEPIVPRSAPPLS
jgi:hypothetical protein